MNVKEKLAELLLDYFHIGDSYHYTLGRDKAAFGLGTMGLDDFQEYDEDTVSEIVEYLIANGVTIQKWTPVEERLPTFDDLPDYTDRDYHLVCCKSPITGKRTVGPALASCDGFADKLLTSCHGLTHWMPMPEPPKEANHETD